LGPDLFKLYINDIAHLNLNGEIELFADNAALKYSKNSEAELKNAILDDLATIDEWLYKNKLLINIGKTKILLFENKAFNDPIFIFKNTPIEVVRSYNYLGLVIDSKVKWDAHVDFLARKISPYVFILRRLQKFFDKNTLHIIYFFLYLV